MSPTSYPCSTPQFLYLQVESATVTLTVGRELADVESTTAVESVLTSVPSVVEEEHDVIAIIDANINIAKTFFMVCF